ncbi:MAG TPA: peptidoglycan DD-metalloendopeptidase family protein [Bacillota bacterium]|nr:peptidoglycan DD-metalloendopeptidase family protein [Bacillota bacterium]
MPDKRLRAKLKGVLNKIKKNSGQLLEGLASKIASFYKGLSRLPACIRQIFNKMPEYKQGLLGFFKAMPDKMQGLTRVIGRCTAYIKRFLASFFSLPNKVKKRLAMILAAFLLLSTGAVVGVSAISAEPQQEIELVDVFRVNLFGSHIGYVTDTAVVKSVIDQIREESSENYGMDVELETAFTYNRASVSPDLVTAQSDIGKIIRDNVEIKVNAFAMMVEDEQICIIRNEEELEKLLDKVIEPFVSSEDSTIEAVDILENVELKPITVDFGQVQDVEDVAEEIARGRETVEEYTVDNGDTLWGIALSYDMSLEDIMDLNPDMGNIDNLKLGQTLKLSYPKCVISVATTEVIEYNVEIPFKTEYTKDSTLYTNQSKQTRAGQPGTTLVGAKVTKVNGIEDSREILSETVTKDPVNRIVAQGTKAIPLVSRGSGALLWPAKGSLTSGFGRRWGRMHTGIDIANSRGTPIYAAEAGRVTFTGWRGTYGNLVTIDHGERVETRYAHLSSFAVSSGQGVKRGQLIGYMGRTGRSTGSHLHFEVRLNGTALNPRKYLN